MVDHELEAKLPLVRAPALVVRGSADPIVPERWARQVANLLPHGRLVVIPGAPHAAHFAAAEKVLHAVEPFLAETVAGDDDGTAGPS